MTKPTISDAVNSLESKGFVRRFQSETDKRSHVISLTKEGEKIIPEIEDFSNPIEDKINLLDDSSRETFLDQIMKVIIGLNRSGILKVQRTCPACRFYETKSSTAYCHLLKADLSRSDIRLDCAEFVSAN